MDIDIPGPTGASEEMRPREIECDQENNMLLPYHSGGLSMSAFDKLSTEIVHLILRDVCPAVAIPTGRSKYKWALGVTQITKLLLVCSQWHDILIADRSMWATMFIDATQFEDDPDEDDTEDYRVKSISHLHRCLEISKNCGLDVTVYGTMASFEGNSEVIDQLMPYSERWRRMTLDLPLERTLLNKLDVVMGRIPLLEHLCLQLPTDLPEEIQGTAFKDAPMLDTVELKHAHVSELIGPLELPWRQISNATFDECDFSVARDLEILLGILEESSLEFMSLQDVILPHGTSVLSQKRMFTISSLESLSLNPDYNSQAYEILDRLTCPSLVNLAVQFGTEGLEAMSLIDFIGRSSCTLESFSMYASSKYHDHIVPVLQNTNLSALQNIGIHVRELAEPITDALILDSRAQLPSLQLLSLSIIRTKSSPPPNSGELWLQLQTLQKIIDSRTRVNSTSVQALSHRANDPSRGTTLTQVQLTIRTLEDQYTWDEHHLGGLRSFCAARGVTIKIELYGQSVLEGSDSGSESDSSEEYDYDDDSDCD